MPEHFFLYLRKMQKRRAQSAQLLDAEMVDQFHWTHQVHRITVGMLQLVLQEGKKREEILRAICCCPLVNLFSVSSKISADQSANTQIISFEEIIYHSPDTCRFFIIH